MAYKNATVLDYCDRAGVTNACDDQLGFSLKPPKWLRQAVSSVIKGATVTVPTPTGPQTISVDDPSAMKQLREAWTPNLIFGKREPQAPIQQAAMGGGGLLIGAAAVLGIVLVMNRGRRR